MKISGHLLTKIGSTSVDVAFEYFMNNLQPTIYGWDYFVDWKNVLSKFRNIEVELNILNSLIGKENIRQEALSLIAEYPNIKRVIPFILATKPEKITVLDSYKDGFKFENFEFSKGLSDDQAYRFLEKSGFISIIEDRLVTSLPNYFLGLEVGIGTNGRKNRSGKAMEAITEHFLSEICQRRGWKWKSQVSNQGLQEWGKSISLGNADKKVDFAINTEDGLVLIETNFYGSEGSKLKATAQEYINDFGKRKIDGHKFIWVTDGFGWIKTRGSLRDAFSDIDHIVNLDMLASGIFEDIVSTV